MDHCQPQIQALNEAQMYLATLEGAQGQRLTTKAMYEGMITTANMMLPPLNQDIDAAAADIAAQDIVVADAQTALNTCQSQ